MQWQTTILRNIEKSTSSARLTMNAKSITCQGLSATATS